MNSVCRRRIPNNNKLRRIKPGSSPSTITAASQLSTATTSAVQTKGCKTTSTTMAPSSSSSASVSPYQSLTKWLSLKIYQVEVTFSVYIFTPLEKFIFCTSHPARLPA